jgi:signal transduction histidine kinase
VEVVPRAKRESVRPDDPRPGLSEAGGSEQDRGTAWLAERRESSLLSLFELSNELGVALDPYGIAQVSLFSLMGHYGTTIAAFWMVPEEGVGDAVLLRAYGLRDPVARALGTGLAPRATARFAKDPSPSSLAEWAQAPEARLAVDHGLSVLVPVAAHGRLIGLLALGNRVTGEPYWPIDLDYLHTVAGMVGVAVQNTRLYHGMLEANRRLRFTNERLTELDRMKNEFLQTVNHELRTPIAIIIGYLSILQDSTQLEGMQQQAVTVSLGQAEKLTSMVRNLLDLSDLSENSMKLQMEPCDLEPVLRTFVESRRPGVVQGPRELSLELEANLPRARCDAARLIQALDALMDNAVKFTPQGCHIKVRAAPVRDGDVDWVGVQVSDNGPGIPQRAIETLFEPFRQVDGSATRETGGLGVGLALVKEIATRMGGALTVETAPGAGTTFTIRLRIS